MSSQLWNDTLNSSSQFFSSSFSPFLTSSSPSFMSYEGKWWMNMKKRHREVSYWLCCCRCISYASVSSIARVVVVQWCTFSIMHQPQIFLCLIGFCGRLKQLHGWVFKFLDLNLLCWAMSIEHENFHKLWNSKTRQALARKSQARPNSSLMTFIFGKLKLYETSNTQV